MIVIPAAQQFVDRDAIPFTYQIQQRNLDAEQRQIAKLRMSAGRQGSVSAPVQIPPVLDSTAVQTPREQVL